MYIFTCNILSILSLSLKRDNDRRVVNKICIVLFSVDGRILAKFSFFVFMD